MSRRAVRWWTLVAAVVVSGVVVLMGFDVAHGLVAGLTLALVVLLVAHLDLGERVELPRLPYDNRDGARSEVSSISWSLLGRDGVTAEGQQHLRRLVRASLTEAGVDVDTAPGRVRAEELLGTDAVRLATDPAASAPSAGRVQSLVTTLESLESLEERA
jgi:hypothetical protein